MNRRIFRVVCGVALAFGATFVPGHSQQVESTSIFDAGDPSDIYDIEGFGYAFPDAVAEFPGLNEQLTAEREQARAGFEEMVAETREAMPDSPMTDHLASQTHWVMAGRTGRLLSLAEATYVYSGGAHGNTGYGARLWDMEEDHAIDLSYLFTDRYAAYAIIDREYCSRLAAEQAERDVPTDDSWWNSCPLLHEQAVALGGETGGPFDTVHIVVGPYVAGPYAAGSFEIAVPVTQALIDLVKPEYRGSFALSVPQ